MLSVVNSLSNLLCEECAGLMDGELVGINHTKDVFETEREWPTPSHKLLALVMSYNCDRRGVVRLTQEELAVQVVLSRQRVARLIDELCEMGILARLGHGRYGLRWGLGENEIPSVKGAKQEHERLRAIQRPDQGIYYRPDGWPVLQARPRHGG